MPEPSGSAPSSWLRDKLRREKLGDGDDPKVMRWVVGMLARRSYSQSMTFRRRYR